MTSTDPYIALALAFGIGLMIGIERGWSTRNAAAGSRVAGVRTYAILGVIGGVIGVLAVGPLLWVGVAAAAAVLAVLALGYRARLANGADAVSATADLVAMLTLMLGILATTGHAGPAVVVAGAVTFLLSMREALHAWLRGLDQRDIKAVAQYAVIACVILPLLPDHGFGPYAALNPRNLWLVVVFVTGISFAGYWASKRLGPTRGTVAAAAIGATYSSTAVSAELARRLRDPSENTAVLRAGIAAATAVMLLRVLVLIAVLVPVALPWFATGIAAATLFSCSFAVWLARSARSGAAKAMPARNPFDFWPAIGFALLIAIVLLLSHWSIARFGSNGLTTLVALTGLYDVDAAIITVGNVPPGTTTPQGLALLLLLPMAINNLWKAALVIGLGGWKQGLGAAFPLLISAVLIAAGWVVLPRLG